MCPRFILYHLWVRYFSKFYLRVLALALCGFSLLWDSYAEEWFDVVQRSVLRGAGKPFPAGELYNFRRQSFSLPNLPDPSPHSSLMPTSLEWSGLQNHYRFHPELQNALEVAIEHHLQQTSIKVQHLSRTALLLTAKGFIEQDTMLLLQSKQLLLSLPSAPSKGSWARNDMDQYWGDMLESSYSMVYLAICYDLMRGLFSDGERHTILNQIAQICRRLEYGAEVIGPNNHAVISGCHLATTLLLLNESDCSQHKLRRIDLWKLSERLMRIGLAQVSADGIYREGPGYAQEVLRSITHLGLLLKLRTNQNLLNEPLLKKLAYSTANLCDEKGNPLPFDDTYPVSKNLWQLISILIPHSPTILSFSQEPPHPYANVEGLFFMVRFPYRHSIPIHLTSVQEIYLNGGHSVWREPNQWVIAISAESRKQWTGRHEQLDIGNLCIAMNDQVCITSGGYGQYGVTDESRRYFLSGESHSSFLVRGNPMIEWVNTPDIENHPLWSGTQWNSDGFFGTVQWIQDGVSIRRNFLRAGKRLILIDETPSVDEVENQFLCNGELVQHSIGDWKVVSKTGEAIHLQTLPLSSGNVSKGITTLAANQRSFVHRIRFTIPKKRITLFSPRDESFALRYFELDSNKQRIEILEWIEEDGSKWTVRYFTQSSRIWILKSNFRDAYLHWISDEPFDAGFTLIWQDERGFALYPSPIAYDELSDSKKVNQVLNHYREIIPLEQSVQGYTILSNWLVYGTPQIQLFRFDESVSSNALSRLSNVPNGLEFSDWYRSLDSKTESEMEQSAADSVLQYAKQALDTLQFHQTFRVATALIDATTDGFVPNVFRIPFDVRETFSFSDSSCVVIDTRGAWGSGLRMDHLRLQYRTYPNGGWEIGRSTPHQHLESYSFTFWNDRWSLSADHSDSYLSGICTRYSNAATLLFFRSELYQKEYVQFSSFGFWKTHQYEFSHTKEMFSVGYTKQLEWNKFFITSGIKYQQNQQNRNERKRGYLLLNHSNRVHSTFDVQHLNNQFYSITNLRFHFPNFQIHTLYQHFAQSRFHQTGRFLTPSILGEKGHGSFAYERTSNQPFHFTFARYPIINRRPMQWFIGYQQLDCPYKTVESNLKLPFGFFSSLIGITSRSFLFRSEVSISRGTQTAWFSWLADHQKYQITTNYALHLLQNSSQFLLEVQWNEYRNKSHFTGYEDLWNVRCSLQHLTSQQGIIQKVHLKKLHTGELFAEGGFVFNW
ncbi:MAG: heparinase II/III family protein [bacterium]|nr:heparinase II/III family protein [bacterium]